MKIYKEKIKVRWSDLDPNMHMANSSYMSFTSFARVEALEQEGITLLDLKKWGVGPVIFEENFSYFKEILPGTSIQIHTFCDGVSGDLALFSFQHRLYDMKGEHKATSSVFGCWLDMHTRKIIKDMPEEFHARLEKFVNENTRRLSLSDLKKSPFKPENIEL